MLSISAVCASDNDSSLESDDILSQDVDGEISVIESEETITSHETDENNLLSEENVNSSFSDLSAAITSAEDNVDLTADYVFNEETDENYVNGIEIINKNIVINGNNHIIDAKNKAGLFKTNGTNLTLNNIIFKNSNSLALNITGGTIITNNVTFMNCGADNIRGGAINLLNATYESNNDKFIDNYAKYGSAIFATTSDITINNTTFKNSKDINWSLIFVFDSDLYVTDTVFTNLTSNYATAIYADHSFTFIRNSKFNNITAKITAGAIGLKVSPTTIEDCEFINVSSAKNGGAVFVDIEIYDAEILINNTLFENCSSEFGGAYLQLAGNCSIVNSTFKNNYADYDGGAVYLSTVTNVGIANSTFIDNNANATNGGAVFIDNSIGSVNDTKFINNNASVGGALYFYDSNYELNNLILNGNGKYPIYSYFEEESERNNLTGTDTPLSDDLFNHTFYPDIIYGPGKQLVLNVTSFNYTVLPKRFNLVDWGLVTKVKNQGSQESCWAFGTIAALESALRKATNVTYDFSEKNLQDSMILYSKYGSTSATEGGYSSLGYGYLLNWFGMVPEEYDKYDELGKISPLLTTNDNIHIQDIIFFEYRPGDFESIESVKKGLLDYGALLGIITFGATAFDQGPETYNETMHSLYTPEYSIPNHAICVVGWDDNFPKENFTVTPPGDGAWIVKNSWGEEWGDNGYFYISYYDQTLCPTDILGVSGAFVGVIIENTIPYTKNYQYDFIGLYDYADTYNSTCISTNKYVAYEDDVIAAIGTYLDPNTNYTIEILINDTSVYRQQGESSYFGYHTIKLDTYVSIKEGDRFAVSITTEGYGTLSTGSRVKYLPGISLTKIGFIEDESEENVNSIKVYTLSEPFKAEKVVETYSENKAFKVNVSQSNVDVSISFDNKTMTNKSDENGIATFYLGILEHGTHPVYVSFNGSTVISTVTVLSTIDVADEIKVACNANKNVTVTFYDAEGNKLNSMTLPLPNEIGTYTLSFTNYKTGEVRNSTINVISRFLIHEDLTTCYSGERYSVMVAGDDGNPAGDGENVTFSVMGKSVTVETTEHGIAAEFLPTEAVPGTYTITATYKGETVSNTVTIIHLIKSDATVTVQLSDATLTLEAVLSYKNQPFYNQTVTFKLNGKTYTTITDDKGVAKVVITQDDIKKLKAGKYTIEITYIKEILKTNLVVKQPLSSAKTVTVKKSAKKLVLKATLKINNVPQANKKITFKFKGKTYTARTDKNGIAKVTIKKKVIKKLKAGGKYTVKISYLKDTIKTTVKVKKLLSGKKTVKVKKKAKKLVLKAKLKDGKTPLKSKKITFKFKGKTYKAKTNKKGIAKVTIKKKVIKKLKAGKKYTAKISYGGEIVKTTVKVKK